jgi:hypothetical protein
MSFTEWYEKTHNDKWHEDYGLMYRFADDMLNDYEKYCKENGIKPIYNG